MKRLNELVELAFTVVFLLLTLLGCLVLIVILYAFIASLLSGAPIMAQPR